MNSVLDTNTVAVLMTCHNRRNKTLLCLDNLFKSASSANQNVDVFLVDDNSTDGTGKAVKSNFPQVNIIKGNGNLFWNKGMRLAWEYASKVKNYDFYMLLNDDTFLFDFGLSELLKSYYVLLKQNKIPSIIAGACCNSNYSNEFSYGGWDEKGPVIPDGELKVCKYTNGNATLIPRTVYEKLGNLSADYTHSMGDFDYGLRAGLAGFKCYTTRKYIAVCPKNNYDYHWSNPHMPLVKRWKLMKSPKGLNISEYNTFRRKFWGWKWIIYATKAYLKVIFPSLYIKISGK